MDQIKIGKFIATCRKNQNLTQMQLAEKLNITDRAISKWETGRALPDSTIMVELCNILKITVNELLLGENLSMENYNKEAENQIVELIKEKEQSDKMLLKLEVVIGVLSTIILLVPVFLGALLPIEENWIRLLVVFSGFIPGIIGFMFALKIEQIAGYYECKECGNRYVPSYKAVNLAMHLGRTRYLKCPKCGKTSWQKKKIEK